MSTSRERLWKVGELAAATGVAARTLHFYAEVGLLVPSRTGASGPRHYTEADVRRLYRIAVLRRLGHPLREVYELLGDGGVGLGETVRRDLSHAEKDPAGQRRRRELLAELAGLLDEAGEPPADLLIEALALAAGR